MTPDDALLIEHSASAWRERGARRAAASCATRASSPFTSLSLCTTGHLPHTAGELRAHPAWHDLAPDARRQAYALACELRAFEALLDPAGLSCAGRAVLERVRARGNSGGA